MEHKTPSQTVKWRIFFENWKFVWRNPEIKVYEKTVLFNVYLYRSDKEGWSISERKMSKDLGISKGRASKAIDELISRGLLISDRKERKRGKLRLSGLLRSPDWSLIKPKSWVTDRPTKYQNKYLNNKDFEISDKRNGKMNKILTPDELHQRIQELKNKI